MRSKYRKDWNISVNVLIIKHFTTCGEYVEKNVNNIRNPPMRNNTQQWQSRNNQQ